MNEVDKCQSQMLNGQLHHISPKLTRIKNKNYHRCSQGRTEPFRLVDFKKHLN